MPSDLDTVAVPSARPIVGTSWKMNLTRAESASWVERLVVDLGRSGPGDLDRLVFVLPPFTAIDAVRDGLVGSDVLYGAQNVHHEDAGPFTGEVSAPMLADLGCRIVEVGHSERRRDQCETDELIGRKVAAILRHGMWPLVCIGESGAEHDAGVEAEVVYRQLETILGELPVEALERILVAYEPWWAIGAGSEVAPLDHVCRMHAAIRAWLRRCGGHGADVPILYGGSVDLGNAQGLLDTPGVGGLFVGRAALDPGVFATIAGLRPAGVEPGAAAEAPR
jgi:triosephosphate isomerase